MLTFRTIDVRCILQKSYSYSHSKHHIQEDTVGCTNLKDGNAVEMDRRYQHSFLFRQQITRWNCSTASICPE